MALFMRRGWLAALAVLFATSVHAGLMPMQPTGSCPEDLGAAPGNGPYGFRWQDQHVDGSFICLGRGMSNIDGELSQNLHIFLLTGTNPGKAGIIGPLPVGGLYPQGVRPICLAQPVWTMPEYQVAPRLIPDWPIQSVAIVNAYDQNTETIFVKFWSPEVSDLQSGEAALQPGANYSINLICGMKQ